MTTRTINRILVATDGGASSQHAVELGARARGGREGRGHVRPRRPAGRVRRRESLPAGPSSPAQCRRRGAQRCGLRRRCARRPLPARPDRRRHRRLDRRRRRTRSTPTSSSWASAHAGCESAPASRAGSRATRPGPSSSPAAPPKARRRVAGGISASRAPGRSPRRLCRRFRGRRPRPPHRRRPGRRAGSPGDRPARAARSRPALVPRPASPP